MKILLASASSRRLELLRALGHEVTAIAPKVLELDNLSELSKIELCEKNACLKADYVFNTYGFFGSDLIISADTLVFLENNVFGKPKDNKSAFGMLTELSNKTHEVITGYCVIASTGKRKVGHVTSTVTFRKLNEQEIMSYSLNPEVIDKCGSYAISGLGACLIDTIQGSVSNIIGLPIKEVLDDAKTLLS